MPGYRFPLQRLLDLRRRSEDEARRQLAASQRAVASHQERLEALQQACSEAGAQAVAVTGQPVRPDLLLNNHLHQAHLRLLATAAQSHVDTAQVQEEADRVELVTKARNREVLERLRDRRHEAHAAAANRLETQQLDEAGTMVFAAKRTTATSDAA